MIGIVPQNDCECLQADGLSLAFQSCRDRIQYRDRHTFIKFHQISINASFFSACHSSQLYSFCEVRGATHFGLPSSLGSPGRAKKPGGVLGTVTQDSSSDQYAAAYFFLQQGCTFNGLGIIATVNVASYQLLEGLITHPELCCQPRDGGT